MGVATQARATPPGVCLKSLPNIYDLMSLALSGLPVFNSFQQVLMYMFQGLQVAGILWLGGGDFTLAISCKQNVPNPTHYALYHVYYYRLY